MRFIDFLTEVAVSRNDPEMDEYYNDGKRGQRRESQPYGDAPYVVGWTGQSWEWYGDENPETGQGRYKGKGDGGRMVAINVPDYQTAQRIAAQLEKSYEDGTFDDDFVYNKQGEDYAVVDYDGTYILPMSKMRENNLHWRVNMDKPQDFAKQKRA